MPAQPAPEGKAMRSPAGLYLLFDPGSRPRRSSVLAAVEALSYAAVSHDPASSPAEPSAPASRSGATNGHWLELLISGMTFDLLGIAPGPGVAIPEIAHRIGCDAEAQFGAMEAVALVAGPHLADGANSLPIVRAMLELGCGLAGVLEGVTTLCWSPARTAVANRLFCGSVDKWLAGGPIPGLGLASFALDDDGVLTSEGLHFFVGQELRFSPALSQDRIGATRLGVRLVHEIVGSGPLDEPRVVAIDSGERLRLEPNTQARLIEISRI